MVSDEKWPSAPSSETRTEIKLLFEECARREKAIRQSEYGKLRDFLISELAFPQFFPQPPELDPTDLLIWQGEWYQVLVALLKKAGDDDMFWYVLAQRLRSEGIREPQNFVPAEVWRRLTKNAEERLRGFLQSDDYNVYLVRIWLPYAEPLVRKTKWLKESGVRNPRVVLESAGYDSPAVNLVLEKQRGWNSAVEFTCEWLEKRTSYTAATLRNSYTRVFGRDVLQPDEVFLLRRPCRG